MASGDFTNSRDGLGEIYHENSIATTWLDSEPLITPEKLVRTHLWGIPLISGMINPFTKRPDVLDNERLKEFIIEAVGLAELESKIDIFPKKYREKHPFDKCQQDQLGYMQLRHRPVQSIQSMVIAAANEAKLYTINLEWIDIGFLHQGQISLIPLSLATQNGVPGALATSQSGGAAFLSIWGNRNWINSFFEIEFTTGFKDGNVPRVVNQLIGVIAAMEVLSMLGSTFSGSNSSSLGIDGLSQSTSQPGMNRFANRLTELGAKRRWLVSRLQSNVGLGIIIDNV
jgi:hypothetical protein